MPRRKRPYGLVEVLAGRCDGPMSEIIREEGPGLAQRLQATFFHCNIDFGLIVDASRAAEPIMLESIERRVLSQEWIALRLTLEHLVYYTGRLQLFLAVALADEYTMAQGWRSRSRFRFPSVRVNDRQPDVGRLVSAWRRLLARQVRRRDRRAEYRLLADAALFVAGANLKFSQLLVSQLKGTA